MNCRSAGAPSCGSCSGKAENLSRFVHRTADAVVFCNAIHLVEDKRRMLHEVSEALHERGLFAFNSTFFEGAQPAGHDALLRAVGAPRHAHLPRREPGDASREGRARRRRASSSASTSTSSCWPKAASTCRRWSCVRSRCRWRVFRRSASTSCLPAARCPAFRCRSPSTASTRRGGSLPRAEAEDGAAELAAGRRRQSLTRIRRLCPRRVGAPYPTRPLPPTQRRKGGVQRGAAPLLGCAALQSRDSRARRWKNSPTGAAWSHKLRRDCTGGARGRLSARASSRRGASPTAVSMELQLTSRKAAPKVSGAS